MKNKKYTNVSYYGVMLCLSLILSYVDRILPLNIGIPGVKAGLANIVVLVMLFRDGPAKAATLNLLRISLASMMFSGWSGLIYSLSGGVFSFAAMLLFKKLGFSPSGISTAGGLMHNIGQLGAAMLLLGNSRLVYYLPMLMISGALTGLIVGILGALILRHVEWTG